MRREEVAQLAGVGVTWYTWLEQGRDINVSTQVLDAIARTLRLDRLERSHLYTLAGASEHSTPSKLDCSVLTGATRRVLDELSPFPAAVLTKRYDVLAYNDGYRKAILDLDPLPVEERNILWLAFTYENWECVFLDEADLHAALVAGFRAGMAEHVGEPAWQDLVDRLLAASPEFAKLWSRHDVAGPGSVVKLVDNPKVGLLRLEPLNVWHGNVRLVVYAPVDEATDRRLRQLGQQAHPF